MKIWTNINKGKWLSKRKVNKICKTKSCSLEKRHGIFTFLKQVEASARKAQGVGNELAEDPQIMTSSCPHYSSRMTPPSHSLKTKLELASACLKYQSKMTPVL